AQTLALAHTAGVEDGLDLAVRQDAVVEADLIEQTAEEVAVVRLDRVAQPQPIVEDLVMHRAGRPQSPIDVQLHDRAIIRERHVRPSVQGNTARRGFDVPEGAVESIPQTVASEGQLAEIPCRIVTAVGHQVLKVGRTRGEHPELQREGPARYVDGRYVHE